MFRVDLKWQVLIYSYTMTYPVPLSRLEFVIYVHAYSVTGTCSSKLPCNTSNICFQTCICLSNRYTYDSAFRRYCEGQVRKINKMVNESWKCHCFHWFHLRNCASKDCNIPGRYWHNSNRQQQPQTLCTIFVPLCICCVKIFKMVI